MTETVSPKILKETAAMMARLHQFLMRTPNPDEAVNGVMSLLSENDHEQGYVLPSKLFEGTPLSFTQFVTAVREYPQLISVQLAKPEVDGLYFLVIGVSLEGVRTAAIYAADGGPAEQIEAMGRGRDWFGPGTLGPMREPQVSVMAVGHVEAETLDHFIFGLQFGKSLLISGATIEALGGGPAFLSMVSGHLPAAYFKLEAGDESKIVCGAVARDPTGLADAFRTIYYLDPPPASVAHDYAAFIESLEATAADWQKQPDRWQGLYFAPEAKRVLN